MVASRGKGHGRPRHGGPPPRRSGSAFRPPSAACRPTGTRPRRAHRVSSMRRGRPPARSCTPRTHEALRHFAPKHRRPDAAGPPDGVVCVPRSEPSRLGTPRSVGFQGLLLGLRTRDRLLCASPATSAPVQPARAPGGRPTPQSNNAVPPLGSFSGLAACVWPVLCSRLGATALRRPWRPRDRGGLDTASLSLGGGGSHL